MSQSQIKCVIFDCDGTLVDSETLCCQALVQVFANYGAKVSYDNCMANFQGGKMFDILKDISESVGLTIPMERLEPQYREVMRQLFTDQLKPIPHALETVQYLISQNIAVCVVSNGPTAKMQQSLELTGMFDLFENNIFSAFDINCWKPEPDLLLYAAMQMGFKLEECLFVDDTENGVKAGINAGIQTIHFTPLEAKVIQHPLVSHIANLSELQKLPLFHH